MSFITSKQKSRVPLFNRILSYQHHAEVFSPLAYTPNLLLIFSSADPTGTVPTCVYFCFSSLLQATWVMHSLQSLGQSLVKLFFLLVTRILQDFIKSAVFMCIPNRQKDYLSHLPQRQTPMAPTMFPFQVLLLMQRTFAEWCYYCFQLIYLDTMEKEMATHSSIFTQRILWTEEPGGLPSMGSHIDTTEVTQQQQQHLYTNVLKNNSYFTWSYFY